MRARSIYLTDKIEKQLVTMLGEIMKRKGTQYNISQVIRGAIIFAEKKGFNIDEFMKIEPDIIKID